MSYSYYEELEKIEKKIKDNLANYYASLQTEKSETIEEIETNLYNSLSELIFYIGENFSIIPEAKFEFLMDIFYDIFNNIKPKSNSFKTYIENYIDIILKIKTIFYSKRINDDFLVRLFLKGKIDDKDILKKIVKVLPFDFFRDSRFKEFDENGGVFKNVINYFKEKDFSEDQISCIVGALLDKETQIDISSDIEQLIIEFNLVILNKNSIEPNTWLYNNYDKIKELEKKCLLSGYYPFLRYEYISIILKNREKIDNLGEEQYKILCGNLLEVLKTDFYSSEQKQDLRKLLQMYTEYGQYLTEDYQELDFDNEKVNIVSLKRMYYNEQIIPYESALETIREIISKKFWENENSIQDEVINLKLKLAIKSIIYHRMERVGITINIHYWHYDNKEKGYNGYLWNSNIIGINLYHLQESLLPLLLGHEMDHAIFKNNTKELKIDYLTFLTLEEKTIRKYYPEYYSRELNYSTDLEETDANVEGYFFENEVSNSLSINNSNLNEELKKKIGSKESKIKKLTNVIQLGDGKKSYRLDMTTSEILGRIIKNDPNLFSSYNGIFNIKYNKDGTEKSIDRLLDDFYKMAIDGIEFDREERINESFNKYWAVFYSSKEEFAKEIFSDFKGICTIPFDYLYSIYAGIINYRAKYIEDVNDDLKKRIQEFSQMNLVSIPILKQYYDVVKPQDIAEAYNEYVKKYITRYTVAEAEFNKDRQTEREGGR